MLVTLTVGRGLLETLTNEISSVYPDVPAIAEDRHRGGGGSSGSGGCCGRLDCEPSSALAVAFTAIFSSADYVKS
jgi:hypothetical protein